MASQVQIGTQTIGVPDSAPLASGIAGINDGATWALKNDQIQTEREKTQAELQKVRVQALKNQMDMGETIHKRMLRIAHLPMGDTKKAEIDLLENDMNQFGLPLHPTARALMTDKNYAQDLPQVLSKLDSLSPEDRVWAMTQLPYLASDEKILDWFKTNKEEIGKDRRSVVNAIGQSTRQQTQIDATKALETMKLDEQKKRQQEEQVFKSGENQKDRELKREEFTAKLEYDKAKTFDEVAKDLKKDAEKVSDDFRPVFEAVKKLKTTTSQQGGIWDTFSMGAMDTLRSGKTSVLREGDVQQFTAAGGLADRAQQFMNGLKEGDKLGPTAKAQAKALTNELEKMYMNSYLDRLSPTYERLKAKGVAPKDVFTGDQIRTLGGAGLLKGVSTDIGNARAKAQRDARRPAPAAPAPGEAAATAPGTPPPTTEAPPTSGTPPGATKSVTLTPAELSVMRGLISSGKATADQVKAQIRARKGGELNPNQAKVLGIQ
jgi:hypothetical protein